jgi:hypothetical protein
MPSRARLSRNQARRAFFFPRDLRFDWAAPTGLNWAEPKLEGLVVGKFWAKGGLKPMVSGARP